jgi:hypothetical protein
MMASGSSCERNVWLTTCACVHTWVRVGYEFEGGGGSSNRSASYQYLRGAVQLYRLYNPRAKNCSPLQHILLLVVELFLKQHSNIEMKTKISNYGLVC